MTPPMLVFGAAGQVGQELMALATERGVAAIGLTRADVDIDDAGAITRAIEQAAPRFIVNAAAYTAVDKAESEPDLAARINAKAPGVIARAAARHAIPVLHLSTDYVFDGTKVGAYTEEDPIAPLGVYGRTKAEGEIAVRMENQSHVILRTSWVYGRYGANFLKTMMRLAAERDRLRVVADQFGCPTATRDIAEAILVADAKLATDPTYSGTYHFAGPGRASWHGFAEAIVAAQARSTSRRPPVDPIGTADYPTPTKRPANSELSSEAFAAAFGYRATDWRTRTAEVVDALS